MPKKSARVEPVAWWWLARNQIGRELKDRYEVSEELPPKLLTLVKKLGDRDLSFPNASRDPS
jgi:hypothetical protein